MDYNVLDETSGEVRDAVSAELTLEPELCLMRVRLGLAVVVGDEKTIRASCDMIMKLVRTQVAIGGKGELAQMLDEVGERVVAGNEAKAADRS